MTRFFIISLFLIVPLLHAEGPSSGALFDNELMPDAVPLQKKKKQGRSSARPHSNVGRSLPTPDPQTMKLINFTPKIIKHYRAEEGMSFPEPRSIPAWTPPKELIARAEQDWIANRERFRIEARSFNPLPSCKENKTERVSRRAPKNQDHNIVLNDQLFIDDEILPAGVDSRFGKHVVVRRYSTKEPNFDSYVTRGNQVQCLPYRVRATIANIFRHYGIDALKNFDNDPNGKGEAIDWYEK